MFKDRFAHTMRYLTLLDCCLLLIELPAHFSVRFFKSTLLKCFYRR